MCCLNPLDMKCFTSVSRPKRLECFNLSSLTLGLIDCKVLTCDLAIGKNTGKKEHFMARAFFSCFKPLGESTLETSFFFRTLSTHILINFVKLLGKKERLPFRGPYRDMVRV